MLLKETKAKGLIHTKEVFYILGHNYYHIRENNSTIYIIAQFISKSKINKGIILLIFATFYDIDKTPVCTTEFIAFAQRYQDFVDRNAQLMGLSIDSNASHIAWIINIYRNTGIEIPFPIIEDRDMAIARMYGMIQPGVSGTETVRNVFFIDPNGIIRAKLIYPLTNGRNIGEILRLLDAMQTTDAQKVATPANWRPGYPTIIPAPRTVSAAMERLDSGNNCMDWYLCYNEAGEKLVSNKSNTPQTLT